MDYWKVVIPILAAVFAVGAAGLTGGPAEADINDSRIQNALNFAVVQHNKGSNGMYLTKVAKVIKVQQQVVAGMKYIFTVEMAKTPCRKSSIEVCNIHTDPALAQPYQCTFEVWSRPWMNDIQLVKNKCLENAA